VDCRCRKPKTAIKIVEEKGAIGAVTPWPVQYDHIAFVYLSSLACDIKESVPKYLHHLEIDGEARDNFRKCMEVYFPR
jgi:hypothetical protein